MGRFTNGFSCCWRIIAAVRPPRQLSALPTRLQQRPSPAGGGVFKKEWLQRYWTDLPEGGAFTQSWDMSFGSTAGASDVCGQVWYQVRGDFYLVDLDSQVRDFPSTLQAVVAMTERWPRAHKKLVEKKANGAAVIDTLKRDVPGLEPIEPEGGKVVRANAVAPFFASGNVFLPHPEKVYKGGEDALYASPNVLLIADGVGGWADSGVDPALYSKRLASIIEELVQKEKMKYI